MIFKYSSIQCIKLGFLKKAKRRLIGLKLWDISRVSLTISTSKTNTTLMSGEDFKTIEVYFNCVIKKQMQKKFLSMKKVKRKIFL